MLSTISLTSVVLGMSTAAIAERKPEYQRWLETSAGVLFIGGLLLLGSLLPAMP